MRLFKITGFKNNSKKNNLKKSKYSYSKKTQRKKGRKSKRRNKKYITKSKSKSRNNKKRRRKQISRRRRKKRSGGAITGQQHSQPHEINGLSTTMKFPKNNYPFRGFSTKNISPETLALAGGQGNYDVGYN